MVAHARNQDVVHAQTAGKDEIVHNVGSLCDIGISNYRLRLQRFVREVASMVVFARVPTSVYARKSGRDPIVADEKVRNNALDARCIACSVRFSLCIF